MMQHRLRLLVHVVLLGGLLLLVRQLLMLLGGLELLLLTLLEAEHLLLLQLLGLLLLRLLVSLVVDHLDVAEAEGAHLELSILLSSVVVLGLGRLLGHLGEVWLGLVVVLLDVEVHSLLGMLQIHLALRRLLNQVLDLVVLLAQEKLLLVLELLLHQVRLLVLLRLLTLKLPLELRVVDLLLDRILVGRLVRHVVVCGQVGRSHILLSLGLWLLALVVRLRLVLLQLLELHGVFELHALLCLVLQLHVDGLRLARVLLLLLRRLNVGRIQCVHLDLLRNALSNLLLVFLLRLAHDHRRVLDLALIVGHL